VQNNLARLKPGSEGFEDGTPNFLAMPAVCDGLNWLCEIGMRRIGDHVRRLTGDLLSRFKALGDRVIAYGPRDCRARGGTFTFNLLRQGRLLPFEDVERAARERGIAIRGGCFCNPGAAEQAFAIPSGRARDCLRGSFTIPGFRTCLGGSPVGAVRASVGIATSGADVDALLQLAADLTES
jgi:selenocysteine lyase/cysteine desulfurase